MKSRINTIALSLCLLLLGTLTAHAMPGVSRISCADLASRLDSPKLIILDVRSDASLSASDERIRGAVQVDPREAHLWAQSLPRDAFVVIYCACMGESTAVAVGNYLKVQGFTHVYALDGGWYEWSYHDYPVERCPTTLAGQP